MDWGARSVSSVPPTKHPPTPLFCNYMDIGCDEVRRQIRTESINKCEFQ